MPPNTGSHDACLPVRQSDGDCPGIAQWRGVQPDERTGMGDAATLHLFVMVFLQEGFDALLRVTEAIGLGWGRKAHQQKGRTYLIIRTSCRGYALPVCRRQV